MPYGFALCQESTLLCRYPPLYVRERTLSLKQCTIHNFCPTDILQHSTIHNFCPTNILQHSTIHNFCPMNILQQSMIHNFCPAFSVAEGSSHVNQAIPDKFCQLSSAEHSALYSPSSALPKALHERQIFFVAARRLNLDVGFNPR